MSKGDETKKKILDTGFELASRLGLECLSIGTLAGLTRMSKSGLFGHFKSKENLQLAVLAHAGEIFTQEVVAPALRVPAGKARIRALMGNWIDWTRKLSGGCIFVAVAAEYSDRPGPIQDAVRAQHDTWIDCMTRVAASAVDAGDLPGDTDCGLFAFELYSLILGFYLYHNSLGSGGTERLMQAAFERLMTSYSQGPQAS